MIVVPVNPNAVEIPTIQTGCLKSQFDSTYPIHLRGIISQDEFQQSIANINATISSRKPLIIFGIIFLVSLFGGIALFIAGGATAATLHTFGFFILIGVGMGVIFLGMMIFTIGCCIVQSRLTVRMQQAIADESRKYSTRSLTPCSWRLASTRIYSGGYGNRRTAVVNRIVIEIGHSMAPESGPVPYQYNAPPPPPYGGRSAGEFCPNCGAARQNPTAKFCSSCGQSLNMF